MFSYHGSEQDSADLERETQKFALDQWFGRKWASAREKRGAIESLMLEVGGYNSREDFLKQVGPQTAVFTLLAGQGTRWKASFDTPEGEAVALRFGITDPTRSRYLAHVPNLFPGSLSYDRTVPVVAYNFLAIKDVLVGSEGEPLGQHIVICQEEKDEEEIRSITEAMGLGSIVTSRTKGTQPLGHAETMTHMASVLEDFTYAITQFGSDATASDTVTRSLLGLNFLSQLVENVSLVLPTARMEKPKYPVFVDSQSTSRRFGHAKLYGQDTVEEQTGLHITASNVGIRAYNAEDLQEGLAESSRQLGDGQEFALDDVDSYLASTGRVRQLAIADPSEILHSAKTLTELPEFLQMQELIHS